MTEGEINLRLQVFFDNVQDSASRAPTVHDVWMEMERVAELDGAVLPTKREVVDHFAWFFGEAA